MAKYCLKMSSSVTREVATTRTPLRAMARDASPMVADETGRIFSASPLLALLALSRCPKSTLREKPLDAGTNGDGYCRDYFAATQSPMHSQGGYFSLREGKRKQSYSR